MNQHSAGNASITMNWTATATGHLGRALCAAVLLFHGDMQLAAQEAAGSSGVAIALEKGVPTADKSVPQQDAALETIEEEMSRDFYLRAGPVFPLGNGFLEKRLNCGWTIQAGLREPLPFSFLSLKLFHESGAGYMTNWGDRAPVTMNGYFRGVGNPDDNHVHFVRDGALAQGDIGAGEIGELGASRLDQLERVSGHYAVGGRYFPPRLNKQPGRTVHLTARTGMRYGYVHSDYDKQFDPIIVEGVDAHFGHGHSDIYFSTTGGKDPGFFFGLFGSVGIEVARDDVRLFRRRHGEARLGLDLEFGHEWMHLGDFSPNDNGLNTFTPMLSFRFDF